MCGNIEYRTLQAVVNEAAENATETVAVEVTADVTIESLTVSSNVDLTITGDITASDEATEDVVISVQADATLTVDGDVEGVVISNSGTVYLNGDVSGVTISNSGTVYLNGDAITDPTSITIEDNGGTVMTADEGDEPTTSTEPTVIALVSVSPSEENNNNDVFNAMYTLEGVDVVQLEGNISTEGSMSLSDETKTVDLNGYTLTTSSSSETAYNKAIISDGASLTICDSSKDGTGILKDGYSERESYDSVIKILANSTLTVTRVKAYTDGTLIFPSGENATVIVEDSYIEAVDYAIATNATTKNNYEGYGVSITVKNSTLFGEYAPICLNVPGTLYVEGSTLTGTWVGLMVRAGEATVKNSSITTKVSTASDWTSYDNQDWKTGYDVAPAAITVGNRNGTYSGDATVTLDNVKLYYTTTSSNDTEVSRAIYAIGGETYDKGETTTGNQAIINYTSTCTVNDVAIDVSKANNVTIGGDTQYVTVFCTDAD